MLHTTSSFRIRNDILCSIGYAQQPILIQTTLEIALSATSLSRNEVLITIRPLTTHRPGVEALWSILKSKQWFQIENLSLRRLAPIVQAIMDAFTTMEQYDEAKAFFDNIDTTVSVFRRFTINIPFFIIIICAAQRIDLDLIDRASKARSLRALNAFKQERNGLSGITTRWRSGCTSKDTSTNQLRELLLLQLSNLRGRTWSPFFHYDGHFGDHLKPQKIIGRWRNSNLPFFLDFFGILSIFTQFT